MGWLLCVDHLRLPGAPPLADPWIALTLIAPDDQSDSAGPLVTLLFRGNPTKLAYKTVTLDRCRREARLGRRAWVSTFRGPLDDQLRAEMLDEGVRADRATTRGALSSRRRSLCRLRHRR
jgi:alkanesulfonate monooxygenase SsuD/methylene tetrahydromethanopterin reductase-like flavin-dependent oxidoreductase (luciferase family)